MANETTQQNHRQTAASACSTSWTKSPVAWAHWCVAEKKNTLKRCSDMQTTESVRLATGAVTEGSRQESPCMMLGMVKLQSYAWRHSQHINTLEFSAFLSYVRSQVGSKDFHKREFFRVFDSRAVCCVVAKGRSSSRILNRLCRRLAGFASQPTVTCFVSGQSPNGITVIPPAGGCPRIIGKVARP